MLLAYGRGGKEAIFPLLMKQLFGYVKRVAENETKRQLRGVTVVLSHGLQHNSGICDLIVESWIQNGINDVLCLADTSGVLLSFIAQTADRQEFSKSGEESFNLIVCNANFDNFQMDVFEVAHDNFLVKYHSDKNIVWGCFSKLRRQLLNMIHGQLQQAGMRPLKDAKKLDIEAEWEEQLTLFNDPFTQKISIPAAFQDIETVITKTTYDQAAVHCIAEITCCIKRELMKFGIMDAKTPASFGKIEILLVGESSRLLPLRNALESMFQKPLNSRILSYVDDAECFGAAIASYLTGNIEYSKENHRFFRLQEGLAFNTHNIFGALTPAANSQIKMEEAASDIFVNERKSLVLSGTLYMGNIKDAVALPGSSLVLSTKLAGSKQLHYIEIEYKSARQDIVFMRLIIAKDVQLIFWNSAQAKRSFLQFQTSFTNSRSMAWATLYFKADRADEYRLFLDDYQIRLGEMVNTFPDAVNDKEGESKDAWASSHTFVALVSDQMDSSIPITASMDDYKPSIITVKKINTATRTVVVQRCQLSANEKLMKSGYYVELPLRKQMARAEHELVVLQLDLQSCIRIRCPDKQTAALCVKQF
ncbi:uncharacterized protein LOC129586516 isoform X2 [Paramacrobiotus metropolitanus]|nr:uncharacterized protein LOC129586516 isoform X2 [Paramacrobiotus metropolitanus]